MDGDDESHRPRTTETNEPETQGKSEGPNQRKNEHRARAETGGMTTCSKLTADFTNWPPKRAKSTWTGAAGQSATSVDSHLTTPSNSGT